MRRWMPAYAGALGAAAIAAALLRPRSAAGPAPLAVGAEQVLAPADLRRARRYGRGQLALGLAATGVETAALTVLARRWPRTQPPGGPLAGGALAGAATTLGVGAASLPLAALGRRRALAAGLATQSWRGWAADVGREAAIGALLAAAGGALAAGLLRRFGRRWWIAGAGVATTAAAAMMFAGPVLLDPLFNRFRELPPGPVREDVLELAAQVGVRVRAVLEVDASRRTTAANAYVTGLGRTRRVVLFDTLLERFTRDEARIVVAHELAHVRHRDVARALGFLALVAPGAALASDRLARELGGELAPGGAAIPALALAVGLVAAPIGILGRALSRAVEVRADALALRATGAPRQFVAMQRRLALQNLADPAPPRVVAALFGSHPPIVERIGAALAYERALNGAGAPDRLAPARA